MNRKFSLAYLTVPGTDPVAQIEMAAAAGYDYVSLRAIPMFLPNEPIFQYEKDPALFAAVKAALAANKLSLFDIELARVREDLDVESYAAAFEKGAELGASWVLSSIWTKDKSFYVEKFGRVCDLAAQFGLKVGLEFVTFAGVTDLDQALETLQLCGRDNAYLMIDTLHAHRSHVTPADLAAVPAGKFGFIHLCDGPGPIPALDDPTMIGVAREGRLYPGEGGVDIAAMFKAMPDDLPVSIELPNSAMSAQLGHAGHAARCLQTAKQYLTANSVK